MLRAETPQEQFNLIGAGRRNLFLNGDMRIDQRNGGATVNPTGYQYGLDRWFYSGAQGSNNYYTMARSNDAPSGFSNSLLVTSTTSSSPSSLWYFRQPIEAYNVSALAYGTSDAKTITASFWVKSSITGAYGFIVSNPVSPYRSYSTTYTVNSANTWEYKTITIVGDTGAVLATGSTEGLRVIFAYGATNYSGASNAWATGLQHTIGGLTDFLGTNGATLYLTGVQIELGKIATPFEHRSYGEELALCQRYFFKEDRNVWVSVVNQLSSGLRRASFSHPVTMRAIPTKAATFVVTGGSASASGFDGGNWSSENKTSLYANGVSEAAYVYMHTFSADAEL
tara:strand:- start:168 stop:1184 length:1017 start_codon:yes stop_codon:yes gene_type:complete